MLSHSFLLHLLTQWKMRTAFRIWNFQRQRDMMRWHRQLSASTGSDQFGVWNCGVERSSRTRWRTSWRRYLKSWLGYKLPVLSQVELSCYMCLLFHRRSMWYENVRGMYGLFHRSSSYTVYIYIQYMYIYIIILWFMTSILLMFLLVEGFLWLFDVLQGLEASDLYRKAREASEMHWLTTRMGHRVPMVWLRRAKLDEKLRQNEAGWKGMGMSWDKLDKMSCCMKHEYTSWAMLLLLDMHWQASDQAWCTWKIQRCLKTENVQFRVWRYDCNSLGRKRIHCLIVPVSVINIHLVIIICPFVCQQLVWFQANKNNLRKRHGRTPVTTEKLVLWSHRRRNLLQLATCRLSVGSKLKTLWVDIEWQRFHSFSSKMAKTCKF